MIGFKRKKILGSAISKKRYEKLHLGDLTDAQLAEYVELSARHKEKQKETDRYYLGLVCEKTGWDEAKAKEEMDRCKEKGISYFNYARRYLWKADEEAVESVTSGTKQEKKRISESKGKYIELIRRETGWSRGVAELETLRIRVNCSASFEDIFNLRLFERSPEEQKEFITLGLFNMLRAKYNDFQLGAEIFDNKENFNNRFSGCIKRKWFMMPGPSLEEFEEKLKGVDRIIVKPLGEMKGRGIESFDCSTREDLENTYKRLEGEGRRIVEEYIVQHDDMMSLCKTAVNTVRVVTLNYEGECRFLYAGIRIGRDGIVDNFHAGGVATTLDTETGTTITDAVDIDGNRYEKSPATGAVIKGFTVPFWNEIRDICRRASGEVENVDLVGWDFAVTAEGPELIEGNHRVGYAIGQVPGLIGIARRAAYPYI